MTLSHCIAKYFALFPISALNIPLLKWRIYIFLTIFSLFASPYTFEYAFLIATLCVISNKCITAHIASVIAINHHRQVTDIKHGNSIGI